MATALPIWRAKLQAVLESWRGTPWVAGCCRRGPSGGVDCVRFVVAVLDELHTLPAGVVRAEVPRLPQDMSLHNRAGAFRVAREIETRYPHVQVAVDAAAVVEAGDVLVLRMGEAAGPGHVMIAGGRDPRELWHAANSAGVCRTSVEAIRGGAMCEIVRIWRPTMRETWK